MKGIFEKILAVGIIGLIAAILINPALGAIIFVYGLEFAGIWLVANVISLICFKKGIMKLLFGDD